MRYPSSLIVTMALVMLLVGVCACAPAGTSSSNTSSENSSTTASTSAVQTTDIAQGQEELMDAERIVITVNGRELQATLEDTAAAQEFVSLLPLRLQMEELNGNEKYAYLDRPLTTSALNPGTIRTGDVMLFGSSCLVLFYNSFPTQFTYTPIAHLEDPEGLADLVGAGDIEAQIRIA